MRRKILSLIMALMIVISCIQPSAYMVLAKEIEPVEKVHVTIENNTYEDGAFYGTIVNETVTITSGMTMMGAIKTALDQSGASASGIENNYISSITDPKGNCLSEQDGGWMGGWMGTLNDWFTNEGFNNISISDEDEIRLMYTCEFGMDIGCLWDQPDTYLTDLTIEGAQLNKEFDSDCKEYKIQINNATQNIKVLPTAVNKNFQVRTTVDGKEYKRNSYIPVKAGTKLLVTCGDPSWPGSNKKNVASQYELVVEQIGVSQSSEVTPSSEVTASVKPKGNKIITTKVEHGSVIAEKNFAAEGDIVSFEVNADGNYAIKSLFIIDNNGTLVETTRDSEKKNTYTFIMPDSEVSILAEFGMVYKVQIYSVPTSEQAYYDMFIQNQAGETIEFDQKRANMTKPYIISLPAGKYFYVFANKDGVITAKNSFVVDETNSTKVQNVYLVQINFTFDTINLNDEANDYQHGGLMSLTDEDGNEMSFQATKVEEGKKPYSGFSKYSYVVQAKGENYYYTYSAKMCDKKLAVSDGEGELSFKLKKYTTRTNITFKAYPNNDAIRFHVSKGAGFGLFKKNGAHYSAFYEYTPDSVDFDSSDKYDIYSYTIPTDNSTTLHVVAGGAMGDSDYIKTAQIFHGITQNDYYYDLEKLDNNVRKGCNYCIEYKNTTDKTTIPLYETTEDDMFLNVEDSNYLTLTEGDTFDLHAYRVTQAQRGATENYFIEPDFHYDIISGDSVEITKEGVPGYEYATLHAVSSGITVIRVRYDAMMLSSGSEQVPNYAYYNATDPYNERIVIVNVDGDEGSINSGIDETEYDTIFYTEKTIMPDNTVVKGCDYATYKFAPSAESDVQVAVHKPLNNTTWETGWTEYTASQDDYYTVKLYAGENIVRITSDDGVSYCTISVKPVTVIISNDTHPGEALSVNDVATISFDSLSLPNKKMSGLYNPGFPDTTWTHYDCDSSQVTQEGILKKAKLKNGMVRNAGGQYVIASKYCNSIQFKILETGTIHLTNGKIHSEHFGSPMNAHRLLDERGTGVNLNASNNLKDAEYSTLPDITLTIEEKKQTEEQLKAVLLDAQNEYRSTGSFLSENIVNPGISSIGGEWAIIGLARSNQLVTQSVYDTYLGNVIATLKEKNGVLSTTKYTEYSRVILGVTAIGADVRNLGGYNLLENLTCLENISKQGINGPIWALIALDSKDYEIPALKGEGTQVTRDNLIESILESEVDGGGWNIVGSNADADMTAMALQALAPYYRSGYSTKVNEAVERGLTVLENMQNEEGEYATYGSDNCESNAQVVVALCSLGIDPASDVRFVKNGNSVLAAMLRYSVDGGGFKHLKENDRDGMATEQAFYALTAYYRMKQGNTDLYDMVDVVTLEPFMYTVRLIDAIPDEVNLSSLGVVSAARVSYDALTQEQKDKVDIWRRQKLENAEAILKQLLRVDEVEKLIAQIGEVTLESKDAITVARRAYLALSDSDKLLVKNYDVLERAIEEYDRLWEEALAKRNLSAKKKAQANKSKDDNSTKGSPKANGKSDNNQANDNSTKRSNVLLVSTKDQDFVNKSNTSDYRDSKLNNTNQFILTKKEEESSLAKKQVFVDDGQKTDRNFEEDSLQQSLAKSNIGDTHGITDDIVEKPLEDSNTALQETTRRIPMFIVIWIGIGFVGIGSLTATGVMMKKGKLK